MQGAGVRNPSATPDVQSLGKKARFERTPAPPPSESLMIFGPGSARFIARSVRAMLVPTGGGRRVPTDLPTNLLDANGRRRTARAVVFQLKFIDFRMVFGQFGRLKTSKWCPGKDSNLHGLHRWYLKPVRLPIPPPGHGALHSCGGGRMSMARWAAAPSLRAPFEARLTGQTTRAFVFGPAFWPSSCLPCGPPAACDIRALPLDGGASHGR